MGWEEEVDELELRRRLSLEMGGKDRVERHHREGKMTIRERIDALVDPRSFMEIGQLSGNATREDGNT